jgi:hypothetical protein
MGWTGCKSNPDQIRFGRHGEGLVSDGSP